MTTPGKSADLAMRRERARLSLEGLSVGDAFGECFFVSPTVAQSMVEQRALKREPWRYTDDTEMALAIVRVLEEHGRIDQDALARLFGQRYRRNPRRGYGGARVHPPGVALGARAARRGLTRWRTLIGRRPREDTWHSR